MTHFHGIRRLMSATVIEPCEPDDVVRERDWQRQVEAEQQVAELRLAAFVRGAKRESAGWITYRSMEARHLDVLAWIAATLRAAERTVATFENQDAFYLFLWNAKREQMGEAPGPLTCEILRHDTRYVWATGATALPEVRS